MLNWIDQSGFVFVRWSELLEIEQFLTLKPYLHYSELFEIELFCHLTECEQKLYLY